MMTSIMNQLTLITFDFSNLESQQVEALFKTFVDASVVLTDCQGNEHSFSVMEILDRETTLCDEDGYPIEEADQVTY